MKYTKTYCLSFFIITIFMMLLPSLFLGQADINGLSKHIEAIEKRPLNKFESISLTNLDTFIHSFENYFEDNFGFRKTMIESNNYFKVKAFNISSNDAVIIGKENWLFYNQEQVLEDYQGSNLFTTSELLQIKQNLEERNVWLNQQGIAFLLILVPNKHSIYGNFIPTKYEEGKIKRSEQLADYLISNTNLNILDATPILQKLKLKMQCFKKTDTHWTDETAFIIYENIINNIHSKFQSISKMKHNELELITKNEGGDLSSMMLLNDWITEDINSLSPKKHKNKILVSEFNCIKSINSNYQKSNPNVPPLKIYFMRDSFGSALVPFLSESSSELTSVWSHHFNKECIQESKPNIVIHEVVERYFEKLLPN